MVFACFVFPVRMFVARRVSASYYMADQREYKGDFDHLALIVTLAEKVLGDRVTGDRVTG